MVRRAKNMSNPISATKAIINPFLESRFMKLFTEVKIETSPTNSQINSRILPKKLLIFHF